MSIADKIQRLQSAKAAIASAITGKGGTVQSGDGFEDFSADIATIPSGITPSGNVDIATTSQVDVTNYATAQVVDADLVAGNIKKDVDILGVVGTYEGGSVDPDLTVFDYSKFTNILQPTVTYWAQTFTGKKAKVIFPDSWNGVVPSFFRAPSTLEEAEIVCNGTVTGVVENKMCYGSTGIKKITMNFSTAAFTAEKFGSFFFRTLGTSSSPLIIDGQPIDLSGVASDTATLCSNGMFYQSRIGHVRFVPNTLNMGGTAGMFNGDSVLGDESLVSLVNVLGETTTGTISFGGSSAGNSTKARCSTLMGTVALDQTGTYHVFTQDASGDTTLADFITSIKGWTLA